MSVIMSDTSTLPNLAFSTPRSLPDARSLAGRVVVLDIAFAAAGLGTPFEAVTGKFLEQLGDRLAAWIDHHDHEFHERFKGDPRFVLATKAEHGACPEMITPELVHRIGPIDTIVAHMDLDGIYAAAKWILGGHEPYPGADLDARKVDTRIGVPSSAALLIDQALRARWRDEPLKHRVIRWLVGGLRDKEHRAVIAEAAEQFGRSAAETERLAGKSGSAAGSPTSMPARPGAPTTRPSCCWPGSARRRWPSSRTRGW
jgi:hypothetical protein